MYLSSRSWIVVLALGFIAPISRANAQQNETPPEQGPKWTDEISSHSALGIFKKNELKNVPIGSRHLGEALKVEQPPLPPGLAEKAPDGSPVQQGDAVSAEMDWLSAVRIALDINPGLASQISSLAEQSDLIDRARAGYRPTIQASVTSGKQQFYGGGQVATLSASQMLYDFGKVASNVDAAEAAARGQQAKVLQEIDHVVGGTVEALVEVHRNQALQKVAEDEIAALNKVLQITELRAQAGASTRSDPIQARSRVQSAEAYQLGISALRQQWVSRLRTYLGSRTPQHIADAPTALRSVDGLSTGGSLDSLPSVLAAQADRATAQAQLRNARAQAYPTISLDVSGNRYMGGSGDYYQRAYGKDTFYTAYVSVSGNLYQGGAVASQRRASVNALQAAQEQVQQARLDALDSQNGYREQVKGLQQRIGVLEERVKSITETRVLYLDQYLTLGTRNVLDLLNAEQEIGQARQDLENAKHDLLLAQAKYVIATGQTRSLFELNNTRVQGVELVP